MAFKSKTPAKGLSRVKPLKTKTPIDRGSGFKPKPRETSPSLRTPVSADDQRKAQQQALQTSTLRALERARRESEEKGIPLTEWEDAFINSVSERVRTYGRAFADPDKGAMNGTLSVRQGVKLREIRKKTKSDKITERNDE